MGPPLSSLAYLRKTSISLLASYCRLHDDDYREKTPPPNISLVSTADSLRPTHDRCSCRHVPEVLTLRHASREPRILPGILANRTPSCKVKSSSLLIMILGSLRSCASIGKPLSLIPRSIQVNNRRATVAAMAAAKGELLLYNILPEPGRCVALCHQVVADSG